MGLNFPLKLCFAKHGSLILNLEMKSQSNNNPLVPQILHMWGILLYVFIFWIQKMKLWKLKETPVSSLDKKILKGN